MPLTARHRLPLVDVLAQIGALHSAPNEDASSDKPRRPMVRDATVVSHSPQCTLANLILTLEVYASEFTDGATHYFWLPLFCCSQHAVDVRHVDVAREAAIQVTRRTCIVLAPWAGSLGFDLTLPWHAQHTIRDVIASLRHDAACDLHLPPAEALRFERALLREFGAIRAAVASLRRVGARAELFGDVVARARDGDTGGSATTELERMAVQRMLAWVAQRASAVLEREMQVATTAIASSTQTRSLCHALALLLLDLGDEEQARLLSHMADGPKSQK